MSALTGIRLERLLGATERGTLWSAARARPGDRIVRLVEPRFCDFEFRRALTDLRGRQYARTLRILSDGFLNDSFFIEYEAAAQWETLEAHFARRHWRARLQAVCRVCEALPHWRLAPVHPLGLHARHVVMVRDAGVWFPWLLLCPPLAYASPHDLLGLDAVVLSALAPEIVRGVGSAARAEDAYALGDLAARALGMGADAEPLTEDERLEAQACGALAPHELAASDVDDFLRGHQTVLNCQQAVSHYTQVAPEARPADAQPLLDACGAALAATDPLELAGQYVKGRRPVEALNVLAWGWRHFGERLEERLLAVEACELLGDPQQTLVHLDRAVELLDGQASGALEAHALRWQLRAQRCELRWGLYRALPALAAGAPDPEGDRLLPDLDWLKTHGDDGARERGKLHMRAGFVYRRRRDLVRAAQEFYAAAEAQRADMVALYSYGECLRELGHAPHVAQLVQEAKRRIGRLKLNEMMEEAEAELWLERFDALSRP
ncbi:MAG TPA: hypothetical protein VF546_11770 [Pyrinomonadaceae bacterium]|jgi:hypothetical protein